MKIARRLHPHWQPVRSRVQYHKHALIRARRWRPHSQRVSCASTSHTLFHACRRSVIAAAVWKMTGLRLFLHFTQNLCVDRHARRNLCVGERFSTGQVYKCVRAGVLFPVRLCGSLEAKSIRQAGAAVGLLNVGSGLQGGSAPAYLITAQMPLFIFRTVQLISVPVSEPLGKSDLLLPLRVVRVLSLTHQTGIQTHFKANVIFTFTASETLYKVSFVSYVQCSRSSAVA